MLNFILKHYQTQTSLILKVMEKLKASDLRIGNWLNNFLGEDFQVNGTTIANWGFPNQFGHPEPIQLTEYWLIKFGFYKSEGNINRFIHETLDVEIERLGNRFVIVIWGEECPAANHYIMHCDKVHTFQNNIFAFCGTELIYNPEAIG